MTMNNANTEEATARTPVLIVGGSLVGLSAAMFLRLRDVPVVLVERHRGGSLHPRAIGFTARTLELFRAAGIGSQIPEVPANTRLLRAKVESLAGQHCEATEWTPKANAPKEAPPAPVEYSPHIGASIAQDRLEPLLRARAVELGADLRLGTELVGFEQDETGVTAHLRERDGHDGHDGRDYAVRADYLIAADGNASPIREQCGIARRGTGRLNTIRSVLFRAPLEEYLQEDIAQFEIEQADFKAFLASYGDGRWALMFADDVERDEAALQAAVTRAIGRSDVAFEIITTGRWELSALIAEEFGCGRIFLAGDSAHTLPPTRGGFGANTGIQDAHNLAWKLAAVLRGDSTPTLLDTYSAEREPVAWQRLLQTFARPDYAAYATAENKAVPIIDDAAMEFGQLYRSAGIIGAGAQLPPALRPDQWAGQPGTRAPHLWIERAGERTSTLDWFGQSWVLLAQQAEWATAAVAAGERLGLALECVSTETLASAEADAVRAAYGLGMSGASLIRPDGYIAWRCADRPSDPLAALTAALAQGAFAAPEDDAKSGKKSGDTIPIYEVKIGIVSPDYFPI